MPWVVLALHSVYPFTFVSNLATAKLGNNLAVLHAEEHRWI